ncbi:MAG: tyrosine-protein phosphatase [Prevotella sp.]|nr:tyrosine-protein phosphatase [Prevotella sp.]MBQ3698690.1 tyrosine-protein phosphatase [Prevotella sp.]
MKRTKLWVLAATLICGASVMTACSSNDDNATEPMRERVIAFEGIENGRDMGGLVMQDGRTVRFDMLVRSGNLATATDGDVAVLTNRFQLSDVFDFRFDAEVAAAPDRVISGVTYTQLSTLPEAFIAAMSSGSSSQEAIDTRDIGSLVIGKAFDPLAQAFARQFYPFIVASAQAQNYYGQFLRGVLAAKGGVLWHCSQGKDRAGWGSAFVLAALGASRQVIVDDFDLSNQSYAARVEELSAMVRDKEGGAEAVAFIQAMVGVSRENFEATLDLIDQQYGSLSTYIVNQLGFSEAEQQQLRAKYLTDK